MRKTVIVRYGELALKSRRVRRHFERRLCENVELILDGIDHKLERAHGRIFIDTKAPDEVTRHLVTVPGVVSVSPATKTEATPGAIRSVAVKEAKKVLSPGSSFAVLTRRVGKHPFSSRDINREVGAAILEAIPRTKVDLSTPNYKIFVEVRGDGSYIFFEIVGGIGGLPVSSQGKVVALFSGGINSFLAACLVLKRGCLVFPIFFNDNSRTNDESRERAIGEAREFLAFHPKVELRIFPFGEVRGVFRGGVPQDLVHVLYMRARLHAAQVISEEMEADAIVTGETMGRTGKILRGFRAVEGACVLPVLRPLAGLDRGRIRQIARRMEKLGVPLPFEPSSEKARHPKADVSLRRIQELERELEIDALVRSLSKEVEVIELR